MRDYFAKLKHTRGFWIFLFGVALVLIAPLPLEFDVPTSGNNGNPVGLGLLYVAAAFVGATAVVIGCGTFTIELIIFDYCGLSIKYFEYIVIGVIITVGSFTIGRNYLALIAAAGTGGPNQTEVFAKNIGISKTPPGFRYTDLSQDENHSEFKLIDATGFGSLIVTIATQSDVAATNPSCAKEIAANAVITRIFSGSVGSDRNKYRDGTEQTLTFFAANRSYSLSTRAIDAIDTMVGNYEWKEPGTHSVPVATIIGVAKQLCAGATESKAAHAINPDISH
jgi:hypothetical protein